MVPLVPEFPSQAFGILPVSSQDTEGCHELLASAQNWPGSLLLLSVQKTLENYKEKLPGKKKPTIPDTVSGHILVWARPAGPVASNRAT